MDEVAVSPPSRVEAARKHLLALKKNAKYSLEKCFKLIQPHVSDEMVAEHLARLRSRDFADIVEERTEVKVICGMPNCATSIVKTRAQILMMNPLKGRIEENTERGKYCSTRCFEKGTEILQALDNSLPLSRTTAEVEAMKAKLKRILAAKTHNLAAVYGDAAEAAAIQHREDALRAVVDEENSFLEKRSKERSTASSSSSSSSGRAGSGNASPDTPIIAGKDAVKKKAQRAHQVDHKTATNHALQEIDHTLEYLGEALPALEFESGDDSDDFSVDGGVASGTVEMVRNAYRADWFARLNNATNSASGQAASVQPCSSGFDAQNRNPSDSPDTLTNFSPSSARLPHLRESDSTVNVTARNDIDEAKPLAAERECEEDMSDLFARIDTHMRQWVTQRTISLLAAATMGLDSSTLNACEHRISEFERQTAVDDAPKAGVVYGLIEQQRHAVLQRQLVSFFAQCNFTLVHRQSGEEFEPGRHGPRSVIALICRSLHLASGKPLPGLQPAHWHLITLAFLAGAGFYAPDVARSLEHSSSYEQESGVTTTNTVAAEWARIQNRCKFLPSELKLFLSPDYWKRFQDRARDLRP